MPCIFKFGFLYRRSDYKLSNSGSEEVWDVVKLKEISILLNNLKIVAGSKS